MVNQCIKKPETCEVIRMALCEVPYIFLHPETFYEFYAMPNCVKCQELAEKGKIS